MKNIVLTVDIQFPVPDDYIVSDLETVEFKGVELFDEDGHLVGGYTNPKHASVSTVEA